MAAGTRRTTKRKPELSGQSDPRAPLDGAALLSAARGVLNLLNDDLLARAKGSPGVQRALRARHDAERVARRTADVFDEWQRRFVAQVSDAWVLSCVFVRTLEDRGLLGRNRLAGPGALDGQRLFDELAPSLTERDYLLTVFRELARMPAARMLFDPRWNPVWKLAPSAKAAKALLDMFRGPSAETPAFRFGQADTRFLGDLYQDLDEDARERFALLQTPRFVEAFILDRTLEPAIRKFGLADTTLLDPTCGSGHFLLGAFERLFEHFLRDAPGAGTRPAAEKALTAIAGVDVNPYAVAIARFRLTLAFLEKAGFSRLADAPAPSVNVVVGDSLLQVGGQTNFADRPEQEGRIWQGDQFSFEDEEAAKGLLSRPYAAVVGNPPYITVKDPVLRERYRQMYDSAAGKYALAAPFTERFFQLGRPSAFVGMINANSFTKREFGKALIEQVLPRWNVTAIYNTAGAYIPGHGTPTLLLFGTCEEAQRVEVHVALAKRGEPSAPAIAEQGLVWRSVADHGDEVAFENEFISVARFERDRLKKHPWSLGGGGAVELKGLLEERSAKTLADLGTLGVGGMSNADDVYIGSGESLARLGVEDELARPLVIGEEIRDWASRPASKVFFPYHMTLDLAEPLPPGAFRAVWPYRTTLWNRAVFGGGTYRTAGRPWYEWHQLTRDRYKTPLSIVFAFVATHNHFILDRGGKVFNRSAPILKLSASATEDDHTALLGYLNSSTACFWMKQVFMNKGGSGIGRGIQDEAWEARFEFDGTKLKSTPLPRPISPVVAQTMVRLAERRASCAPATVIGRGDQDGSSLSDRLAVARAAEQETFARMVALQEEMDWLVYEAFGLLSDEERTAHEAARSEAFLDFPRVIHEHSPAWGKGLLPGHRPFEILLAAQVQHNGHRTAWFERNGYASPSTGSASYSASYQRLIETRIAIIRGNSNIALLEQPEFKRRWTLRDWDREVVAAASAFVLDACEGVLQRQLEPLTTRTLKPLLGRVPQFLDVSDLLSGTGTELDLRTLLGEETVPYLRALRFSESGIEKSESWEQAWRLQRREDGGEVVGDIPVPRAYEKEEFATPTLWRLRGKLDVPRERFISYPGCESDHDGEPLYGWAGWNHLQRAQVLAGIYQKRKSEEAWPKERLIPLLAGLLELIPWIKQWHNAPSVEFGGLRLGDYFETFLVGECREHGITQDDLRQWRPVARSAGKARKKPADATTSPAEE